jgi:hypothetical protein
MFVAAMISMKKAPIEEQIEMNPDLVGEKKPKARNASKGRKKKKK